MVRLSLYLPATAALEGVGSPLYPAAADQFGDGVVASEDDISMAHVGDVGCVLSFILGFQTVWSIGRPWI